MKTFFCWIFIVGLSLTTKPSVFSEPNLDQVKKPSPNSPDEPFAKAMSLVKAVEFIDRASLHWQESRECVTCHTNGAYLIGRAKLKGNPAPHAAVRSFFEEYVAGWKNKQPGPHGVVATASALALDDAANGQLSETTRYALLRHGKLSVKMDLGIGLSAVGGHTNPTITMGLPLQP